MAQLDVIGYAWQKLCLVSAYSPGGARNVIFGGIFILKLGNFEFFIVWLSKEKVGVFLPLIFAWIFSPKGSAGAVLLNSGLPLLNIDILLTRRGPILSPGRVPEEG